MTMVLRSALIAGVLAGALYAPPAAEAAAPESPDPIKMVLNNWPSQLVQERAVGGLLQKMGYNVEYVPANTQLQFPAMGAGEAHVQVEVWQGSMVAAFEKEVNAGRMIDAGTHTASSREDWWYPIYLKELCPGLPDWQALNACAELFVTPETAPLGRYVGGAVEWDKHDQERIDALGLNFAVINAGSTSALISELDAAYKRKAPLVMFFWQPNWALQKYEGEFVNFPEWAPECISDPSWGPNPELAYDCGNAKSGWLKKGVWAGMAEKYPCALELIRKVDFTPEMVGDAAYFMDVDGLSEEAAAAKWLEKYSSVTAEWLGSLPGDCAVQN
jgi:glycine betaine/proline transport system substrate-binding protein